jgi:hypothetical protein
MFYKMNKFLIYTSNPKIMPKSMADIVEFAKNEPKFRIANVELNTHLANVKAGDHIVTTKGNNLYVIKAYQDSLENLSEEERTYIDTLTREYAMKKVNITGVSNVIKFENWCKSAKPLIKTTEKEDKMNKANSIKGYAARIKEMFMPTEAKDIRVATDGNLCVATSNGYVAIDAANNLLSYPEEFTIDLPVYIISKPKEQLKPGDVIALERSYAKVVKIEGDKITGISYTGSGKTIHLIKDVLFNQAMVRVAVSLTGSIGGQINPMLLMALNDDDKKDSLLPLLLMNQQGGAVGMNPMLMLALAGKEDGKSSLKDLLMMSALTGNNLFGGAAFGVQAPAQVVDAPAEAEAPAAE